MERRQGVLGEAHLRRAPVGVVGAIVPWNVPQYLIMPKLIPALIAGCTVIIKPAPETPLDALWLAEMIEQVGLPEGVVSVLPGGRTSARRWCAIPVWTRSPSPDPVAAGRRIAALCGEQLKRVSLELGGKSAAIILDDADIGKTVAGLKMASLMNNGQACVAQTRILVSERRHDEFVDALAEMMSGLRSEIPPTRQPTSDPLSPNGNNVGSRTSSGPAQQEGARVVLGGQDSPAERGWYVRPTLFADATNDMRIAREEIFGPVLTVLRYTDEDDAVRHRQRQRLRPGRFGLDRRHRPRPRDRRRCAHRHLRHQHVHARHQQPVRRLQAIGHRTRVRARGPRRVCRAAVGGVHREDAAALNASALVRNGYSPSMQCQKSAIAAAAIVLTACGGSSTKAAVTVTSTLEVTKTVTVTGPPPPNVRQNNHGNRRHVSSRRSISCPAPISSAGNRPGGESDCYWARLHSLNSTDIITNDINTGPQTVKVLPSDTAFLTHSCQTWQKTD